MPPFLEVVTRHYAKRPNMFKVNQSSLGRLRSDDWVQTLLVDEQGRGVEWANHNLAENADGVCGQYIWVLDDDDLCIYSDLVDDLKAIAAEQDPDVIMLRGDYSPKHGVLPSDENWKQPPAFGYISMGCFIVRREVYQVHAEAFRAETGADFYFIKSIFDAGQYNIVWLDKVAMRAQRISQGAPE